VGERPKNTHDDDGDDDDDGGGGGGEVMKIKLLL
jgi:hypothetical protein